MVFDQVFKRFIELRPISVMHRAVLENVFAAEKLDAVFHASAVKQYERELLFSTTVEVMSLVVARIAPSVRNAYFQKLDEVSVTVRSLYDKLAHVEPATSRALLRHTAIQVSELIHCVEGSKRSPLPGYRVLTLDGCHPEGTEHRLGVLRDTAAGALPGLSLVLLDVQKMLAIDAVLCEDGHAQERSLLDEILPSIGKGDVVIDDRNFCTRKFLAGIAFRRKAYFITRQHARMPWTPEGKRRYVGQGSTGRVYEQAGHVIDPETGRQLAVRRITVKLKTATRDGDREIHLLTNLPKKVGGVKVAELYRGRWTIEQVFNELTTHLCCEPNTLGYPKAALFAFSVALCCYNLLSAVKGVLRGVHGEKTVDSEVSNYFLAEEISRVYDGMMIALPPANWQDFQAMTAAQLGKHLRHWAKQIDLTKYPKHKRGPKRPRPRRPNAQFQHVSTARLLAAVREKRKQRQRKAICTA
jgi:hypothetical protein